MLTDTDGDNVKISVTYTNGTVVEGWYSVETVNYITKDIKQTIYVKVQDVSGNAPDKIIDIFQRDGSQLSAAAIWEGKYFQDFAITLNRTGLRPSF